MFLEVIDAHPELARDLGNLMVLEQPQVLGDDLCRRRVFMADVAKLQPEAFLQVTGGDADRIEGLNMLQRLLDVGYRPIAHRRHFLDRRHQIAIVV